MYKSIFLDYFKEISTAISWYIFAQLVFLLAAWFNLHQAPKYKLFMLTTLTLSILQIGLSVGYLFNHQRSKHSIYNKTEFGEEWLTQEKPRIEKLILGYKRTITIWLFLIATVCIATLLLHIEQLRYIGFALIIQLSFTLIMDIYGSVKTEFYYHQIK